MSNDSIEKSIYWYKASNIVRFMLLLISVLIFVATFATMLAPIIFSSKLSPFQKNIM